MKREPLVLAFALVFPLVIAWLYFVVVSPTVGSTIAVNHHLQIIYAIGKVIQFSLPIAWIAMFDRNALRPTRPKMAGLRSGIVFGCLVAALAFVLYGFVLKDSPALADAPQRIRAKLAEFGMATPIRYAVLAGFLAVINSFLEEYYWRWFVFGRLRQYMPVALAIVVSSLGFMAHHVIVLWVYFPGRFLGAVVPFSLAIAAGGAVWAWIYHKSGSIVGPWISHLLVDVAVMLIGYDLAFRQ